MRRYLPAISVFLAAIAMFWATFYLMQFAPRSVWWHIPFGITLGVLVLIGLFVSAVMAVLASTRKP